MKSEVLLGDCLELLQEVPSQSVDLILTDPPYGVTASLWDSVISFELLYSSQFVFSHVIKICG